MPVAEQQEAAEPVVVTAIQKATGSFIKAGSEMKAKDARLRLMKERNEMYLAEQRDEEEADKEITKELQVSTAE